MHINNRFDMLEESIPQSFEVESVSLFGALTPEQLGELWTHIECRHYTAGEKIFSQGDLPSDIFILASGRVDFVVEKGGVHRIEQSHMPGDTFGETAFIGIQPQVGSAMVAGGEVADVLVISRGSLMQIHVENPELFGLLMMNLAREVSRKFHRTIEKA